MLKTNHKGYMMLNRNFAFSEYEYNEYDAVYFEQVSDNTLTFNRRCKKHYQAIGELFDGYYPDNIKNNKSDEESIINTKNEFLIVMFDYDYDYPKVLPEKVSSVTIILPYSLEIYSDAQISLLEEVIDTCWDFKYIEIHHNNDITFNEMESLEKMSTAYKIEQLQQLIELAKKEKVKKR